jgi:hypothetical protein
MAAGLGVGIAGDLAMKGGLVGFDGEQIVALATGDGGGDGRIAGDGVDGDQRTVEIEPVEDVGG